MTQTAPPLHTAGRTSRSAGRHGAGARSRAPAAAVLHVRTDRGPAHVRDSVQDQALHLISASTLDGGARFVGGVAGLLWALSHTGADVPAAAVERLVGVADVAHVPDGDGAGLAARLSGTALALDGAGRHDDAERYWRWVETVPLERLDVTVAHGLAASGSRCSSKHRCATQPGCWPAWIPSPTRWPAG
ncbi:hypothetical protein [Georgenia yuyongxinii]